MPYINNELERQGKRIATLKEYAECLLPMKNEEDNPQVNQWGLITDSSQDLLTPLQTSEYGFRFMPASEFSPRIYRGENEFHPVCVPNLYRPGIRPIDALFWRAKWYELSLLLNHHPAVIDLRESRIGNLTYAFVLESIAQHYQYKTTLLDFSRSKDVAMFFATCQYNEEHRMYQPLQTGTASFYTADLGALIKERHHKEGFVPLGFEPLPRPEAQKALGVRLMPNENLNDMPWVVRQDIDITPELSEHYYQLFDGGAKLMPTNPFDSEIQRLVTDNALSPDTVAFAIAENFIPPHPQGLTGALHEFTAAGYNIKQPAPPPDTQLLNSAQQDWANRQQEFYQKIQLRGVCGHLKEGQTNR